MRVIFVSLSDPFQPASNAISHYNSLLCLLVRLLAQLEERVEDLMQTYVHGAEKKRFRDVGGEKGVTRGWGEKKDKQRHV